MVAFGRALLESQRPGWEDAYVDYKGLKDLLRNDDNKDDKNDKKEDEVATEAFERKLRYEIEKVSLFALHRQGEIAQSIGALRLPKEADLFCSTSQQESGALVVPSRLSQTHQDDKDDEKNNAALAHAYTQCAVELLHWQRFVCINAVGIRKILKKFRKHYPKQWIVIQE